MNTRFYLTYLLLLLFGSSLFAQYDKQIELAKQHLQQHKSEWGLSEQDIADIKLDYAYQSEHNGVTHIYFKQQYTGIEIFNAIYNANILPNGKILYVGNRFYQDIATKVNTTRAILSPDEAVIAAAKVLNIDAIPTLKEKETIGKKVVFQSNISKNEISVELIYQPTKDGALKLAWQLAIKMLKGTDYWNLRIDAQTGELLEKHNWTRQCTFPGHDHSNGCGFLENSSSNHSAPFMPSEEDNPTSDGATYEVFPVALESPLDGGRTVINDPSDPTASPFGWHDVDGNPGAEFTITRGNNVHAYADPNDVNRPDINFPEPDGGDDLVFSFPFDPNLEPLGNVDAAVTQLFYMNNVMHDFSYSYGFNEAAGNFQENNFSNLGKGNDSVNAEALDDASGDSSDNASFSSPPDGLNGGMNMFVWNRGGSRVLFIEEPEALAGGLEVSRASFGGDIDSIPLTGEVAIATDGGLNGTLACNPIQNREEVEGKIVLIDRGTCFFVEKARNAQEAGAIAVVVCNFENSRTGMGAPDNDPGDDITIPLVMLTVGDCQTIKQNLDEIKLSMVIPNETQTGPDQLDGDFDNGIIAHEYGHGISIRLTGGPTNAGCLFNDEEMGEGWSDFFTLVTSVKPGDTGKEARGIGNYVLRNDKNAPGVRSFPYSTDFSVNSKTYRDIIATGAPHPLGEVWNSALWDMYWAFVDQYGYDPDLYNGTGGNNLAIQLVMDGLKIQPCRPGFIDGRDALLMADEANNGGANQCLIWEVFARRGLGFSADQGSTNNRNDMKEGFDIAPACIKTVKIEKTVNPTINAGDDILVNLQITNHKDEPITGLMISDEIPEGASLIAGSATKGSASQEGNEVIIELEVERLNAGATIDFSYQLSTDPNKASISQFKDGGEEGNDLWLVIDIDGSAIWELQDAFSNSGDFAWNVPNVDEDSQHTLLLDEEIPVSGSFPAVRFFHTYDIEPGLDGGFVELSTDGGTNWVDAGPHFIRNSYDGPLAYTTFAIPDKSAFWGATSEFEASYIDLRSFMGENVMIRFRYGSPEETAESAPDYQGWFIDDVEFMDLLAYNSEVCLTTDQGDNACALANEGGTLVEVGSALTSVENLEENGLSFQIFPNPAGDYVHVSLSTEQADEGTITLFNMNGQAITHKAISLQNTTQFIPFNVGELARGFYFVEVRTAAGVAMKKLILE